MILGEIKKALRDVNSLRVPRSVRDSAYQMLRARDKLERDGKPSSFDDVATELGVAAGDVAYALNALSDTVSLYEPVFSSDGDELLLMDQIEDDREEDDDLSKMDLKNAFALLESREKKIVYLRYYKGLTQTEISSAVGLSQAQVSRLEKNALVKMKGKIVV